MTGGTIVEDAEQARYYSALPEANREYAEGSEVKLDPCVPAHELALIQEREGRPCPRVDLEPENYHASALAYIAVGSMPFLFGPYYDAATEDLPARERLSLIDRIVRAAQHPSLTQQQKDAAEQVVAAYSKR